MLPQTHVSGEEACTTPGGHGHACGGGRGQGRAPLPTPTQKGACGTTATGLSRWHQGMPAGCPSACCPPMTGTWQCSNLSDGPWKQREQQDHWGLRWICHHASTQGQRGQQEGGRHSEQSGRCLRGAARTPQAQGPGRSSSCCKGKSWAPSLASPRTLTDHHVLPRWCLTSGLWLRRITALQPKSRTPR